MARKKSSTGSPGGASGQYFLGLDSSTQTLKAALIDSSLKVVYEKAVMFDRDLPEFKTEGGAHKQSDGLTVTSPTLMWVAALDLLFDRMKADKCPFGKIAAVAGSGQQHGSVWLKKGGRALLKGMNPSKPLREQFKDAFSIPDSPIWMDSSTTRQCRELETALGGAQSVADLTGSRAFERFTGNQIAKIYQNHHKNYDATERICLVSSFMASLLAGDYAGIDTADGSGMNLMDIRKRKWAENALQYTAPELDRKLGEIIPGHHVLGTIHGFFVQKYGFAPDCKAVAWSGDNPCSLAGLRLQMAGDIAISLGTSDTMFGSLSVPKPSAAEGHIFANPVDPDGYMAMVVHKNGSLTREAVRDRDAGGSWDEFGRILAATPPGNHGCVGFYIDQPEISPPIMKTGIRRFDKTGTKVEKFADGSDVRAVVESQFMSLRLHGGNIGLKPRSILATGGASANVAIVSTIADVFGVPVFVGDQPNSAAVGAAYRALHAWRCASEGVFVTFADAMTGAPAFKKAADPDPAAHAVYTKMLKEFQKLERKVEKEK